MEGPASVDDCLDGVVETSRDDKVLVDFRSACFCTRHEAGANPDTGGTISIRIKRKKRKPAQSASDSEYH